MQERIPMSYKSASVELLRFDTYTIVQRLYSGEPKQGHATELMQQVIEFADRERIKLVLEARQFGNPYGLSTEQLKTFYGRFGFTQLPKTGDFVLMERNPSQELQGL